jgi:hypothetical protein
MSEAPFDVVPDARTMETALGRGRGAQLTGCTARGHPARSFAPGIRPCRIRSRRDERASLDRRSSTTAGVVLSGNRFLLPDLVVCVLDAV